MKKLFQISFVFLFLMLNFGIIINKHYSGDELFSMALFGEAESCCDGPCNCCHNETIIIQFSADYLFSPTNVLEPTFTITELFTENVGELVLQIENTEDFNNVFIDERIHPPGVSRFLSQIQTYLL